MAEYGKVYKKIWNNPRFRALPESAKHLFLYLISNQHCNLLGLYTLHLGYIMGDLNWSERRTLDGISTLTGSGFVEFDKKASLIFIKSWFEHNPLTSELQTKKALAELSELPKNPVFMQKLRVVLENGSDQFSKMVLTESAKWFEPNLENGSNSVSEAVSVSETEAVSIPFFEILEHLAGLTGKRFRSEAEGSRRLIRARWGEGWRLDDFRYVHYVKVADWQDTDMEKFLRPETLYGNKFEGYRNQRPKSELSQMPERQRQNTLAFIQWLKQNGVENGTGRQDQVRVGPQEVKHSIPENGDTGND